jgi:SAM-dependent methyltransferase
MNPSLATLVDDLRRSPLPPPVAFMRLAMAAASPAELAAAIGATATDGIRAIAAAHPEGWRMVRDVMSVADHAALEAEPVARLAAVARMFDAAAAISPAAGVALYSLGDNEVLDAATAEIVDWLVRRHLLGPDRRVLDFGCGAGRLLAPLAPLVRCVTGVDVSGAMVVEAKGRCAGIGNVRVQQIGGLDLGALPDASFDLVVALDSMPYVVGGEGALAERLMAEAARVLVPGGHFAIFNYSYRGDAKADRRDVLALARRTAFSTLVLGEQPFTLWDGTVYLLERSSPARAPGPAPQLATSLARRSR